MDLDAIFRSVYRDSCHSEALAGQGSGSVFVANVRELCPEEVWQVIRHPRFPVRYVLWLTRR